jgi:chemotaxis protein CheZ
MLNKAETAAFRSRVEELKKERGEHVDVNEIGEIVESLLHTLEGDVTSSEIKLYQELDVLARYIRDAKTESASIHPEQIQSDFIDRATDELDAIVKSTEAATGTILDSAETLEKIAQEVAGDHGEKITAVVTAIYEACNFQDITGQRINKVVNTLKHIEAELDKLVALFGDQLKRSSTAAKMTKVNDQRSDKHLLNGPQLAEKATSQAEIDALLASFD